MIALDHFVARYHGLRVVMLLLVGGDCSCQGAIWLCTVIVFMTRGFRLPIS